MIPPAVIPVLVDLVIDRVIKPGKDQATAKKLAAQILTDKEAMTTLHHDLLAVLANSDTNQTAINRIEATSDKIWKAGWRPAAGWICIIALGWHYLLEPMLVTLLAMFGISIPPLPRADFNDLWTLLFALLGMSGLRSIDKYSLLKKGERHDS
ncbi:MAG: holin family protein [Proteobacteria bacterium]|nr:holin family protein [Pseudomonadota bacterium]